MRIRLTSAFILLLVSCCAFLHHALAADSSFTLTTYYPAPSGDYQDVTVTGTLTAATLNVTGNARVTGELTIGDGSLNNYLRMHNTSGNKVAMQTWLNTFHINPSGVAEAYDGVYVNTNVPKLFSVNVGQFVVNDQGRVGIGVADPTAKLDVAGTISLGGSGANLDGADLSFLQASSKSLIGWNRSGGGGEMAFIQSSSSAPWESLGRMRGGFKFYDQSPEGNMTDRMTIRGDTGNVGIAKDDPKAKLDVNGSIQGVGLASVGTTGDTAVLDLVNLSKGLPNSQVWRISNDDNNSLTFLAHTTTGFIPRIVLSDAGGVGIGRMPISGAELAVGGDVQVTGDVTATGKVSGAELCIGPKCVTSLGGTVIYLRAGDTTPRGCAEFGFTEGGSSVEDVAGGAQNQVNTCYKEDAVCMVMYLTGAETAPDCPSDWAIIDHRNVRVSSSDWNAVRTCMKCMGDYGIDPALCGNNILDAGEGCDLGSSNATTCVPPYGGQCNYCASTSCVPRSVLGPYCGDGFCDGGYGEGCASCSADCYCSSGGGASGCFTAGTRVLMADGVLKDIVDVSVGDFVQGSKGAVEVKRKYTINYAGWLYSINGSKAFVTASHPFMTTDGWRSFDPEATRKETPELVVTQLQKGDTLITRSGHVIIEKFDRIEASTTVYNMDVIDHEYYADGYHVHNVLTEDLNMCIQFWELIEKLLE